MSFYFPDGKGGKKLVTVDSKVPRASAESLGGVIVDGNGLEMDGDTLKLKEASVNELGGVKVGKEYTEIYEGSFSILADNGLYIEDGVLKLPFFQRQFVILERDRENIRNYDHPTFSMPNESRLNFNECAVSAKNSRLNMQGSDLLLGSDYGDGNRAGSINLTGNYPAIDAGGIDLSGGGNGGKAGTINLNGGAAGGAGGVINLNGNNDINNFKGSGGAGGTINLTGGWSWSHRKQASGGTIDMSPDGSIKGDIVFTGTPTFLNGANGLNTLVDTVSGSTIPSATTSQDGLMSKTDKAKLNGIDNNANNYALPTASTSTKGGVKVGAGLAMDGETLKCTVSGGTTYTAGDNITISGGKISAANTTYTDATTSKSGLMSASDKTKLNGLDASKYVTVVSGKQLSTNDYTTAEKNKLASIDTSNFVTVTSLTSALSGKVDKVSGKQLSTEDFTTAEKNKLANLTSGVTYTAGNNIQISNGVISATDTKYTLPTASEEELGGVRSGAGLHMNGTALNLEYASAEKIGGVIGGDGLTMQGGTVLTLQPASKTQIGGIKVGAGLAMDGETLKCTLSGGSATYSEATSLASGLMSIDDKIKLDKIKFTGGESNPTAKYIVPDWYYYYNGSGGWIIQVYYKKPGTEDWVYIELPEEVQGYSYAKVAAWCEENLPKYVYEVNYDETQMITWNTIRIGNIAFAHEYNKELPLEQLTIAFDVDADGTTDSTFQIPANLEGRLSAIESSVESQDTAIKTLQGNTSTSKFTMSFDALENCMKTFGVEVTTGDSQRVYTYANGTSSTVIASGDEINFNNGLNLLCRAIKAKVETGGE